MRDLMNIVENEDFMQRMHRVAIDTELLKGIPQQPQVQCSFQDQMDALHMLAVKFGLYDAADFLKDHARRSQRG